jgi:hypothetical protein
MSAKSVEIKFTGYEDGDGHQTSFVLDDAALNV